MNPVVACVGTTHPYGSAGLLLELTAVRALGARPVAVVAGVSAQTAGRVTARLAVDPATIAAQFAALADAGVGAISIGALLDAASVEAVAQAVHGFAGVPVICDPVIAASGGDRLADDATVAALRERLFPVCTLITPNLAEAGMLAGMPVDSLAAMHRALPALLAFGSAAVLLKGGHLEGDPVDLLGDRSDTHELRGERVAADVRGTGSLLGAAIATRCAFGEALSPAVAAARAFVRERIATGIAFAGMRVAY